MLSRTEEMLLLVVCRLEANAYGNHIRAEVETLTGKKYSIGGIYVPLDRLVQKGWLATEEGHPTAARMGRPRRLFKLTGAGYAALREARDFQQAMWEGLPELALNRLRWSLT